MSLKTIGSTSGTMPTENAALAELLGLQPVAIFEPGELLAAFRANRHRADALDAPAIVNALTEFWRRKRGFGPEAARTFLWNRHPRLFAATRRASSGTTSANSVAVAAYARRDSRTGKLIHVSAHTRADLERLMKFHDSEKFKARTPEVFRAHDLSLRAFTASDKAGTIGGESWHEEAARLHGEAAEQHEMLGDKETAGRHRRAADHHASRARSEV